MLPRSDNIHNNTFAEPSSSGFDNRTNGLGTSTLFADNLAHVFGCDAEFKDDRVPLIDLFDGYSRRVADQGLHHGH